MSVRKAIQGTFRLRSKHLHLFIPIKHPIILSYFFSDVLFPPFYGTRSPSSIIFLSSLIPFFLNHPPYSSFFPSSLSLFLNPSSLISIYLCLLLIATSIFNLLSSQLISPPFSFPFPLPLFSSFFFLHPCRMLPAATSKSGTIYGSKRRK